MDTYDPNESVDQERAPEKRPWGDGKTDKELDKLMRMLRWTNTLCYGLSGMCGMSAAFIALNVYGRDAAIAWAIAHVLVGGGLTIVTWLIRSAELRKIDMIVLTFGPVLSAFVEFLVTLAYAAHAVGGIGGLAALASVASSSAESLAGSVASTAISSFSAAVAGAQSEESFAPV
jgi:hypothetical protein